MLVLPVETRKQVFSLLSEKIRGQMLLTESHLDTAHLHLLAFRLPEVRLLAPLALLAAAVCLFLTSNARGTTFQGAFGAE